MQSSGGITIDDIFHCYNASYHSGIRTQLYYAPSEFFSEIKLPGNSGNFHDALKVNEDDIQFKGSLGWSYIDILIDENELKSVWDGGVQQKKSKSKINFFVLGYTPTVLGFVERLKNIPLVFAIRDNNETYWLLGNLRNRAFLESAEGSTGKKYEENSGISVNITANTQMYYYRGNIILNPGNGSGSGGFIDLTQDY